MVEDIKKNVKETYGKIAKTEGSCCASSSSCCSTYTLCCGEAKSAVSGSKLVGYTDAELDTIPEGADLGLGCGNPVALASLKEGEVVLDLGSGAGIDCFLAANKVGQSGKVIGVDMTPEMLDRARENAIRGNYSNVEFRLGEIENLPVESGSVDVVISNCVINLSSDKRRVFDEAYRVLKPGGRLMVSDIVLDKELPETLRNSIEAYVSCVAGASPKSEYLDLIRASGFQNINIDGENILYADLADYDAGEGTIPIISLRVSAVKPGRA